MKLAVRLALVPMLAGTIACSNPDVMSANGGGSGSGNNDNGGSGDNGGNGGSGGGTSGGSHAPDAGFGFSVPDASTKPPPSAMPMACATSAAQAHAVPLDVFLLVDTSGSMADPSGGQTKWQMVRSALVSFLGDPGSAGLGAGLEFFPRLRTCTSDAQCTGGVATCSPAKKCVTPGQPVPVRGDCVDQIDCSFRSMCMDVGICPSTGAPCAPVGQPCTGTMTSEMCMPVSGYCDAGRDLDPVVCDAATYAKPTVEIAPLPPNAGKITDALKAAYPQGGTPMKPALSGAYGYVRDYAAAHMDRKVVMVLATDGVPEGCSGSDAWTPAAMALAGTPSISTYAIGVFAPSDQGQGTIVLNQVAQAGGTGKPPFILQPGNNLAQAFLSALNQIRGAALPCAYAIPTNPTGAIDYGKVNVHFETSSGTEVFPYVRNAGGCDATKGGWYYDVEPTGGSTPKQVVLCPASCQKVTADSAKNDPKAKVTLEFGCQSQVIQ